MQESIRRYAEETRRTYGVEVQIRVGLNSGEVVVQSIGNDLRMDYTAVGETVHLAARLEQLATPGTIRLTAKTVRLVEGYVQVKPLGAIPVKGLVHPVEAYEAISAGSVRTSFQAATARGLARFVGRDTEVEQLERALDQAKEGHGRIIAVIGEPGIGKSRLFHELTHSQQARNWLILNAGCVSYGKATSYLPVIDLLKEYFHIGEGDDHQAIREKAAAKLLALDRSLEPTLTPLLALLDVPVDGEWRELDPPRRRQQMLDAVKRLLLRESQVQPLLAVFEDLHWIDAETQALLDSLVGSLATSRLLLLVSYRPEYQHGWSGTTYYSQLRLDALPAESSEELLRSLLGDDSSTAPLKKLLAERTAGNPLFLEESVRSLVETGALAGTRGAYRLAHPLHSVQIPPTIQAILASRIDRLPPDEKRLLQSAAVIGKVGRDVPFTLIREIAEQPDERLRASLAHLQASELLYETSHFPDLEYTFKHALTHETAYGSMLHDRRRALHAAIVDAIERLYAGRSAEHVERLAHHSLYGELWEKAVDYFHSSARKARARSAYREAAACYDHAIAALAHLPDDRAARARGVKLRFELHSLLAPLGETSRAIKSLNEAEPLAEALGDRPMLARLLSQRGTCLWLRSRYDLALESGQRALDIAIAIGDRTSQVNVGYVLGMVHYTLGNFSRAIDTFDEALRLLDEEPFSARFRTSFSVNLRVGLALTYGQLGRITEGLENANETLRTAEATGDSHELSVAHSALGFVHFQKGDFETAVQLLERGLEICERTALAVTLKVLSVDLARSYAHSGRPEEGARLIEQTLERVNAEIQVYAGDWQTYLGEAYLRAGRLDEAGKTAVKALHLCRTLGQRGAEAQSLYLLGEIACSNEPPDLEAARRRFGEAMARAQELGMQSLVARCHLSLGELGRRGGQHARARQHLDIAASLYREMGISFWLEKVEVEAKAIAR
jgi:tetratricopeptide (TPR) repeat protein